MGNAQSNTNRTNFRLTWAKRFVSFFCIFAVVYGVLMALWPVGGSAYSKFYCVGANRLLGSPGARAVVHFSRTDGARDEVRVTFYDRQRTNERGTLIPLLRIAHDVHYGVYIYVAFMVALIVATPVSLKRRAWALLWGLIAIHAFMAIRLVLLIVPLLSSKQVALLVLNRFWHHLLFLGVQVFTINVLPSFVVVIVLWVLLSFRRHDWPGILMPEGRSSSLSRPRMA